MLRLLPKVLILGVAASVAGPPPVRADKPHRPKAHEHPSGKGKHAAVGFSVRDRDAVRAYFVKSHGRGHCPPGLAKKGNGCLPPGLAKKRYVVGEALPAGIVVEPLPEVLVVRLGPPPEGYRYGVIDGDVVKLVVGTLLVADAIDGLVN